MWFVVTRLRAPGAPMLVLEENDELEARRSRRAPKAN
jgi:hypothetical protein